MANLFNEKINFLAPKHSELNKIDLKFVKLFFGEEAELFQN